MGCSKTVLRGKFIAIQSYIRKQEKISNKQLNLTPNATREKTPKNPKVSRSKEIIRTEKK